MYKTKATKQPPASSGNRSDVLGESMYQSSLSLRVQVPPEKGFNP